MKLANQSGELGVAVGSTKDVISAGWAFVTVGDSCVVNPRTFLDPVEADRAVSFIPMASVEAKTGRIDLSQVRTYGEVSKGYTRFSEGDVLFAKITPCMENGKIAIAKGLTNGHGCGSTEFHVLRPHEGLSRVFLNYFLLQDEFRKDAQRNMAGTVGQLRVSAAWLSEAPIPLPPLAEQRRIVGEIETQFTRLDASVAALRRAQANLKRYRASVLKDACEGRLVPTEVELARSEGREYEPTAVLLERILAERRVRWESQEKRRGKYREPSAPDASALPQLPEGWVWASLDQLASIGTGSTPLTSKSKYYQDSSVPWVTSSALNEEVVSSPNNSVTERAVQECRLFLYPAHTLLVAMYGEGKTRGKCSELLFPSTINQAIAAVTMEDSAANCRSYSKVFLQSNYEATRRMSSGGVQPNLNLGLIKGLSIPLPPLAEQHRIVAEVERRLSVVQQAEATVEASLARAERLRQSILKQAFSGRLVPQDLDDEPASVLLERIRAEREAEAQASAAAKGKSGQRSRKKATA